MSDQKIQVILEAINRSEAAFNALAADIKKIGDAAADTAGKTSGATSKISGDWMKLAASFTAGNLMAKGVEMVIQSLDKLKDTLVEMTLMAARAETLGVAMRVVGNNAGYTNKEMDAAEQQVRKMGIATLEARESLARMAGAQMDVTKASALARIAQDAAVLGGINSSEAFARMIQGIRSGGWGLF